MHVDVANKCAGERQHNGWQNEDRRYNENTSQLHQATGSDIRKQAELL